MITSHSHKLAADNARERLIGLLHRRGRGDFELFTVLVSPNDPARAASVRRQMPYEIAVTVWDRVSPNYAQIGPLRDWLINTRGLKEGRDFAYSGRMYDGSGERVTFFFKSLTEATYFKLNWC